MKVSFILVDIPIALIVASELLLVVFADTKWGLNFMIFSTLFPDINRAFLTSGGSGHRHHPPVLPPSTDANLQNQAVPDYVVKQRDEISIVCDVLIGLPDMVWLHNGELVDIGHRYSRQSDAIHIVNVRLEDDGYWQCRHRDNINLYAKPKWLMVLGK